MNIQPFFFFPHILILNNFIYTLWLNYSLFCWILQYRFGSNLFLNFRQTTLHDYWVSPTGCQMALHPNIITTDPVVFFFPLVHRFPSYLLKFKRLSLGICSLTYLSSQWVMTPTLVLPCSIFKVSLTSPHFHNNYHLSQDLKSSYLYFYCKLWTNHSGSSHSINKPIVHMVDREILPQCNYNLLSFLQNMHWLHL